MDDPNIELQRLRRRVAQSADTQVRRVVAEIDGLASRGEADALIAPLRPRLDRLQVAHPLRLPRLLFIPLDPLLVTATEWRLDEPTVPRSVIMPMTRIVATALGDEADAIRRAIRDHTTADLEVICASGATLWPLAAAALAVAEPPGRWHETGLSGKAFRT